MFGKPNKFYVQESTEFQIRKEQRPSNWEHTHREFTQKNTEIERERETYLVEERDDSS